MMFKTILFLVLLPELVKDTIKPCANVINNSNTIKNAITVWIVSQGN